jgi:hypothetical protein
MRIKEIFWSIVGMYSGIFPYFRFMLVSLKEVTFLTKFILYSASPKTFRSYITIIYGPIFMKFGR